MAIKNQQPESFFFISAPTGGVPSGGAGGSHSSTRPLPFQSGFLPEVFLPYQNCSLSKELYPIRGFTYRRTRTASYQKPSQSNRCSLPESFSTSCVFYQRHSLPQRCSLPESFPVRCVLYYRHSQQQKSSIQESFPIRCVSSQRHSLPETFLPLGMIHTSRI